MAGHSKWANIKHKKKAKDKKKSMLFSKLAKEIKTSLNETKNNGKSNKLKNAINKALDKNLNKNIIKKIISKNEKNKKINILFFKKKDYIIIIEIELDEKNKNITEIKHTMKEYDFIYIENNLNTFEKENKIKINNKYNEKSITILSKKFNIKEFKDDTIFINNLDINDLKNSNKKNITNFESSIFFKAKNYLKINENEISNLKKKITKKEFIKNIYSNIENLI